MSLLYNARWQAFDNSGNPIVGATLTVYNAGGTVLASIYRDAALGTPMNNPTSGADKSDAAGRFPQVFTAENAIFDVLLKDSLGNTVASYVNVVGLGTNSGTFTRDFTNSRVSIRGSGGTVYIEAGDPTGDDVGGKLRFGGWLGTQADTLILDAAAISATGTLDVAGALTVNGNDIPAPLATGAISGASLIVPLATGIRGFTLELTEIVPSGPVTFALTASVDGGLTYLAGTNYTYRWVEIGAASTEGSSSSSASVPLTGTSNFQANAGEQKTIKIEIDTPLSGSFDTKFRVETYWGTTSLILQYTNAHLKSNTRVTHLKIAPSSGTATGRYRLLSRGL